MKKSPLRPQIYTGLELWTGCIEWRGRCSLRVSKDRCALTGGGLHGRGRKQRHGKLRNTKPSVGFMQTYRERSARRLAAISIGRSAGPECRWWAGAPPINVLVLCPGGLEHGGGIGRQMGYFLAALPQAAETPAYRVIDTRGHGSSAARAGAFPVRALPCGCGVPDRVGGDRQPTEPAAREYHRPRQHHRKLVLTAIARAVALPYVLHIHDYDYAADVRARGGPMRRLVRGMFAAAVQIIVLGTEAERILRAALALPDAPILVLPNAVPDPHPAPRTAVKMAAAGPVHLVFLGYLSARKGVPELLGGVGEPGVARCHGARRSPAVARWTNSGPAPPPLAFLTG